MWRTRLPINLIKKRKCRNSIETMRYRFDVIFYSAAYFSYTSILCDVCFRILSLFGIQKNKKRREKNDARTVMIKAKSCLCDRTRIKVCQTTRAFFYTIEMTLQKHVSYAASIYTENYDWAWVASLLFCSMCWFRCPTPIQTKREPKQQQQHILWLCKPYCQNTVAPHKKYNNVSASASAQYVCGGVYVCRNTCNSKCNTKSFSWHSRRTSFFVFACLAWLACWLAMANALIYVKLGCALVLPTYRETVIFDTVVTRNGSYKLRKSLS